MILRSSITLTSKDSIFGISIFKGEYPTLVCFSMRVEVLIPYNPWVSMYILSNSKLFGTLSGLKLIASSSFQKYSCTGTTVKKLSWLSEAERNLSIQEYRQTLSNNRIYFVVDKPKTKIMPELYEDNNDLPMIYNDILNKKPIKNKYVLKRNNNVNDKKSFFNI